MSVRSPPENHGDDKTMQEALTTAAALAAAAMEDIVTRDSSTSTATAPPVNGSLAKQITQDASSSIPTPPLPPAPTNAGPTTVPTMATNTATLPLPVIVPYPAAQPQVKDTGMHPRDYVCYSNNPVKTQHTLLQQPLQHALPVPLVFQPNAGQSDAIQLRRGKWTADEEAYAEFLIKEFERGMVEGCENGCTLRSFLSKKLHCAPMRISKKFAGKSIGKHVFLSRAPGHSSPLPTAEACNKARLKELETNFCKSLQRESEAVMPYLPPFPAGTVLLPVPHQTIAPCAPASFLPFPQPCDQQANQLRHTFMSALHQRNAVSTIVPAPTTQAPPTVSSPPTLLMPTVSLSCAEQLPVPIHAPQQLAARQQTPQPEQQQQMQQVRHDKSYVTQSSTSNSYRIVSSPSADLPDFLSGFEKVTAQTAGAIYSHHTPSQQLSISTIPVDQSQYSPPFTSRSFDDLHQHLGKGLSPRPAQLEFPDFPPLPSSIASATIGRNDHAPTSQSLLRNRAPVESVTADSYSVFAQQSANAVSQHSAYFREAHVKTAARRLCDEEPLLTPAVVNAENLRVHSMVTDHSNFRSASENLTSEWDALNIMGDSSAVVSGSDNSSDTRSNDADSDSNYYDEGPEQKKIKVE